MPVSFVTQRKLGLVIQSIAIFRKGQYAAYLSMVTLMLRMMMAGPWYNPNISTQGGDPL